MLLSPIDNFCDNIFLNVLLINVKNGWYMSIWIENTEVPKSKPQDLEQVKTVIGCDLGIKKLLALSNGELIENPQFE
ncbi:MAG: hypothetical protein AB4062_03265 [Crocosphaera sp.]